MMNWRRCEFVQPIATWITSWSFSRLMSLGTSSRRQFGGSIPSSVTLI
jgi:hypothetical protein